MRTILTLLVTAALAVTAAPAGARSHQHHSWHQVAHKYLHYRHQSRKAFGDMQIGRDIARDGIRVKLGAKKHHKVVVRRATRSQLSRSTRTYQRWLAPPPAPIAPTDNAPAYYNGSSYQAHATYNAGGSYSIPSWIVQRESGGSYTAVNSSSGARGAYQMLPSTYANVCGTCDWSPADQDAAAAKLWNLTGGQAWAETGG